MGRYTLQKKLTAVEDYASGELGLRAVAQLYDVDFSSLRQWVAAYRAHGIEGLKHKRRELYSAVFKLEVLQRVQTRPDAANSGHTNLGPPVHHPILHDQISVM